MNFNAVFGILLTTGATWLWFGPKWAAGLMMVYGLIQFLPNRIKFK